ncbi:CRISPR-associated endonuclease Cas2 [soil metagenome]
MARSTYVVAYDIADDKRRAKVYRAMLGFGDWAQYSVFFCDLSSQELVRLRWRIRELINEAEDQVIVVEGGNATRALEVSLEAIGKPYDPVVRSIVI